MEGFPGQQLGQRTFMAKPTPSDAARSPRAVQVLCCLSPSSASQWAVSLLGFWGLFLVASVGQKLSFLPLLFLRTWWVGRSRVWGGSAPLLLPGGHLPGQGSPRPLQGQGSRAACC